MDSDFMNNLANAMKNGNIPDDIKNLINNMKNNSNDNIENTNFNNVDNTYSPDNSTNNINPEMLKNIMNMFNNSNNSSTNSNTTNGSVPNIDINTLLKMKSVMDKMNNNKDDPRSNLLLSLKPYLKDSRKNKVEQYVQLFNISKVFDVFGQTGGENSK